MDYATKTDSGPGHVIKNTPGGAVCAPVETSAQRLNSLVTEVDSVIGHLNNFKNTLGLSVNPEPDRDKVGDIQLVRALDEVPCQIRARCEQIHGLINEIEDALR